MLDLLSLLLFYLVCRSMALSSTQLDLAGQFNDCAFGADANMDGLGHAFIAKDNEPESLIVGGVLSFSNPIGKPLDNLRVTDQADIVSLGGVHHHGSAGGLVVLVTASHGPVVSDFLVSYEDGSTTNSRLIVPDWQQPWQDMAQIERWDVAIRSVSGSGMAGGLYAIPIYTDPAKSVSKLSVSLIPTVTSEPPNPPRGNGSSPPPLASQSSDGSAFSPALHVFGATLLLSSDDQAGRGVQVTGARASHRFWQDDGGSGAPAGPLDAASRANAQLSPVILLRLANLGNSPLSSVTVHLNGSQISTIHPGQLAYLAPGHMATLEVGIQPSIASANAADVTILVYDSANGTLLLQQDVPNLVLYEEQAYDPRWSSLQNHHAPTWFKQAKFGIFVHWGLYSVPAWAPVGKEYAEWYWYQMNHENDPTYAHHKKTYGEQFAYDDFIPLWQPNAFDPKAWLDVIDRSRATYFVFTSKHHDGYALFDTKVSNRSSVSMHPHHDFVGDLITTAKQSYPHLKRGLYFSLPEWYNPSYHGIDNLDDWHGPPTNPYTHATVPYTGNTHIKDFVNDLQVPQFLELVHQYEPDILWCDIGGINNSSHWQVDFYNRASAQGRQVTINDRCGNGISDFSTLEYQSTAAPPPRQWEATRGIDPRSFGFNQATPPEDYASSKELLHDLIDAVAMGGNFLLNIGPMANGSIHWVMTDRLNAMGAWLDIHGASIFDTEPYWQTSQDQDVRYTMSRDGSTFYILLFAGHPSLVSLRTPLPLQPHSTLSVMGGAAASQLNWRVRERDHVIYTDIDLPPLDSTLATVISCKLS